MQGRIWCSEYAWVWAVDLLKKGDQEMENMREDGSIGVLNSLAWLNLFGGVLGAIIIFGNWGFIKTYSQTVFNPIVIGISIGLLIQGIFG